MTYYQSNMVETFLLHRHVWSLAVIDYMAADQSIRINSEAYRAILSAHIQLNAAKADRFRVHIADG